MMTMRYLAVGISSGIVIGILVALISVYAVPAFHSIAPGC